ncbi:DNA processing protein [Pedobacter westerhofensis]|uniref:DNA processing protein n=1 Tax=Pedobacter westerhofensis TaxID=425512 RepID=A0A521EXB4_9SPHI|nr:DNA-processing protein DprA [Pedobacter westerhofensis]SMO88533.1 DNA processing protein [Pedobacter westerhofensis]
MSLTHQIALTLVQSVGHVTAKSLLARFGTPEAVFSASMQDLLQVEGIGAVTAGQICRTDALVLAEKQLKFLEKHQIDPLFYTDERYPKRLKNCYDAPVMLYYRGTANLNHPRIVSVVGTRRATSYGLMLCEQLAETLKDYGVLVVSGLAYGIDVAAHRQSLLQGIPTVGVLGHGLDRLYPSAHRQTANEMIRNGGLLTEFPLYTNADKENFPKRNRIIAGIADVTVVVEAALKGGALITAELANSYNRDVFAFPGRTTNQYSEGCNFLIKTNRAGLISHPRDLAYFMGWEAETALTTPRQSSLAIALSATEQTVITVLQSSSQRIDELSIKAGIPQSKLAIHLLNLEIKGLIVSLPGSVYQLV